MKGILKNSLIEVYYEHFPNAFAANNLKKCEN